MRALVLCGLLWPAAARAAVQTTSGTVVTQANDPLAGAQVTLLDPAGAVLLTTTTDANGRFTANLERKGPIIVRVEVSGLPRTELTMRPDQTSVRVEVLPGTGGIELNVTGEKVLPKAEPEPTKYALDHELMSKLPGTRGDAFAAITSLPSMGRPPALSTVFVVRGAGPEATATFVDGAPLPQAFHFGGLVSIVPSSLLSSIAVLPGGFGVGYGRATAGVVDATLATPKTDGVHGTLGFDALDVGATLTAPLIKGRHETTISLGARRSHVDAWIGSFLGDAVAGELPRYLDGQIVLEHAFSTRTRARTALLAANDSVSVTDPNSPADKPRSGTWNSSVTRAHLRLESKLDAGGSLLGVFSAGASKDSIIGDADSWENARKTLYGRLEAVVPIEGPERAKLGFGADVLATQIDGLRSLGIPTSSFGGSAVFQLRGAIHVSRAEPGAWAQLALEPIRGWTVISGVRVDRSLRGDALFQPRLALRGEVTSSTALKSSVGLYARSNPHDAVDARDFDGTLLPVAAQPGPVRGAHGALGFEHAFARDVVLTCDVWGRAESGVQIAKEQPARPSYDELLSGERVVSGYYYPLNADTARTRAAGVEMLFKFGGASFAGFIGYGLSRSEIRDDPYAAWRRAPFDQTHVVNAALIGRLGEGWEAGARFRLAVGVLDSAYPATEIAPKNDPNVDPNRALPQLAPIHSLDLRLEKTFRVGPGSIGAYLEVRNVYDRRAREPLAYNHVYGYPVVGSGLPIIPNLGVRGAF